MCFWTRLASPGCRSMVAVAPTFRNIVGVSMEIPYLFPNLCIRIVEFVTGLAPGRRNSSSRRRVGSWFFLILLTYFRTNLCSSIVITTFGGPCLAVLCLATLMIIIVTPPSMIFSDDLNSWRVAKLATPGRCQFFCTIKVIKAATTVLCSFGERTPVSAWTSSSAMFSQRGLWRVRAISWERGLGFWEVFSSRSWLL